MMNTNVNRLLAAAAIVASLGWGLAATDDPIKFGVIDMEQAILSTDEGRAVREELEGKIRDADSTLRPKVQRLQEMQQELEEMQHVLSKDALERRQFDFIEARNQLENDSRGMEQQVKLDRARLLKPLQDKFVSIVEQVGRDNGFSIIMLRNAPGIMYAREALDVTDLVVEKFNAHAKAK
jgi:outer membrane protein